MRALLLSLASWFIFGCGGGSAIPPDAAPQPIDPTGNWSMTYSFAADSCGHPAATASQTITITKGPNGYVLSSGTASASGTITCDPTNCKLSAVLTFMSMGANFQQNNNLTLFATGSITGSGSETATSSGGTCTTTFTVTGAKM